jgi:hypothetical protein
MDYKTYPVNMKPKLTHFLISLIFIALFAGDLFSQCSDAGICILGKRYEATPEVRSSFLSLSYVLGSSGTSVFDGDEITYNSVKFGGELQVFRATRFGFSIPYSYNIGTLGTASGVGDLSIFWTYSLPIAHNNSIDFQLGAKLSTGKTNTTDSLPQSYMPGLGTNDLLISAGYETDYFGVSVGYQKPFGRSNNDVTRLKRGDDLMFRAAYFQEFNKLSVKAEVITILRLQESSIQDPLSLTESFITKDGSNEPQVNLLGEVSYAVSKDLVLTGNAALPLLKRDYNYDGLRRSFTFSAGVAYIFSLE